MRQLLKNILGLLLLPPVLWLFLNASLNWHYHRMPNGQIVCHAHPYTSSHSDTPIGTIPFEKHQHSDNEYLFYAFLGEISVVLAAFILFFGFLKADREMLLFPLRKSFVSAHQLLVYSLRGPPSNY